MATKLKTSKAPVAKPDPIFALIESAKAALDAFMACDPREPGNMPRSIELGKALSQADDLLSTAVPRTRTGTIAYAEWHLRRHGWGKSLLSAMKRELAA